MPQNKWPATFAFMVMTLVSGSGLVSAQISETASFLANVSNQYRVVPNVVYHVANNYENKLDLYLPTDPSGPTPVLMMIHGVGWVQGTKESQVLRLLPYLEKGWAVAVSYTHLTLPTILLV